MPTGVFIRKPFEQRFWDKVQKTDTCWNRVGGKGHHGYGRLGVKYFGERLVHKISYILHFGPIPKGMEVCHRCDNTSCVKPDHLFIATHFNNMQDMVKKQRHIGKGGKPGIECPSHKLTEEQVKEIKSSTDHWTKFSNKFNISRQSICDIRCNRTWKHIHN